MSNGWDISEFPWRSSLRSSLLTSWSRLRVGSRTPWSRKSCVLESGKVRSPIIVDTLFLHHIQICVSCPGRVTTFVERSESESWKMCAGASTSVSSGFSVNSSNHSGISRKRSSDSRLRSLFLFWFWVLGGWSAPVSWSWSVTSLQGWTCWRQTCNVNVEDELLPEWADNPGTTSGTTLSVLHIIVFSSLVNRGFWPLTHSW